MSRWEKLFLGGITASLAYAFFLKGAGYYDDSDDDDDEA